MFKRNRGSIGDNVRVKCPGKCGQEVNSCACKCPKGCGKSPHSGKC
ncbi:hypothetical protein [Nocardiopsis sp. NPDC055824]